MPSEISSISDLFQMQAKATPRAIAVRTDDRTISYGEVESAVARCAALLERLGVTQHSVCGLACASPLTFLYARIAMSRLKTCSISLHREITRHQVEATAHHTGMTAIVGDFKLDVDGPKHIQIDERQILASEPVRISEETPNGASIDSIVVGSGSTGKPKHMAYSNGQSLAVTENFAAMMKLEDQDVVAPMTAIHFVSAQRRCFAAFSRGASVVIPTKEGINPVTRLFELGATVVGATVWHTELLLRSAGDRTHALPKVRMLEMSGSTVSESLIARVHTRLTPNAFVTYGANECTCVTMRNTHLDAPAQGSVGRVLPNARIQIVDPQGAETRIGEPGLIRTMSMGALTHYLDDPANTARAFKDGWFYPGDVGLRTEDDQIIHLGRADDMMIFSGVNIYPAEIELTMAEHPAVRDVAVLPVSHHVHQDVPVCAVSLLDGFQIDETALHKFGRKRLSNQCFSAVFVVPKIPRNANGKLERESMRQIMIDRWNDHQKKLKLDASRTRPLQTPGRD